MAPLFDTLLEIYLMLWAHPVYTISVLMILGDVWVLSLMMLSDGNE